MQFSTLALEGCDLQISIHFLTLASQQVFFKWSFTFQSLLISDNLHIFKVIFKYPDTCTYEEGNLHKFTHFSNVAKAVDNLQIVS